MAWRKGDYLTALEEGEVFDGILTNPPYIPSGDIPGLQKEVQHEPALALDGGKDGLDFYRKLADSAALKIRETTIPLKSSKTTAASSGPCIAGRRKTNEHRNGKSRRRLLQK